MAIDTGNLQTPIQPLIQPTFSYLLSLHCNKHPLSYFAPYYPSVLHLIIHSVEGYPTSQFKSYIKYTRHIRNNMNSNNIYGGGGRRNAMASVDFYRRVPKDLTEVRIMYVYIVYEFASFIQGLRPICM